MRAKALALALLAAIIALPVPASQLLAGSFSSPAPVVTIVHGDANLAVLLEDPFLIDRLSYSRPASFFDLDA